MLDDLRSAMQQMNAGIIDRRGCGNQIADKRIVNLRTKCSPTSAKAKDGMTNAYSIWSRITETQLRQYTTAEIAIAPCSTSSRTYLRRLFPKQGI
ncbi:hypothetical protein ACQKLX_01580 [Bosea sp. NPDC003192]|uniref:hypothetical protein n=1 Tax=Bosea sp. NPDC003192 TaxID=3390551 RepID=UPI003D04C0DB